MSSGAQSDGAAEELRGSRPKVTGPGRRTLRRERNPPSQPASFRPRRIHQALTQGAGVSCRGLISPGTCWLGTRAAASLLKDQFGRSVRPHRQQVCVWGSLVKCRQHHSRALHRRRQTRQILHPNDDEEASDPLALKATSPWPLRGLQSSLRDRRQGSAPEWGSEWGRASAGITRCFSGLLGSSFGGPSSHGCTCLRRHQLRDFTRGSASLRRSCRQWLHSSDPLRMPTVLKSYVGATER